MNPHLLAFLEATAVVAVLCLAASAVLGLAVVIVGRLPAHCRPNQPGSLGESDWPVLDEWERHVQSTPGMGVLGETPIFDGLCFEAWEAEGDWPDVYSAEDFTGGDAA